MSALSALRKLRRKAKCDRSSPDPMLKALRAVRAKEVGSAKSAKPVVRARMSLVAKVRLRARVNANGNRSFSGVAYTGGVMYPSITMPDGRVERGAVVMDLDTLTIPRQEIPVLDDHDESPDGTIGRTLTIGVKRPEYTMPVTGVLYANKARTGKFVEAGDGGHKWQLSVGTDGFTIQRVPAGKRIRVNGRHFTGPLSVVRGAYLTDLSFVTVGADDRTEAVIAARRARNRRRAGKDSR